MKKESKQILITPKTNLFKLDIKEIIEYKDLIYLFVKRDFITVYRQTVLGPLWHLIQPLFTSITFYLVFNRIAHLSTDNVPPIIFYMSANIIWNFFASSINKASNVFIGNASVFGKVYFPRITVPLSYLFSNAISFVFQLFFLFVIIGIYWIKDGYVPQVSPSILLLPLVLLVLGIQGLSIGMILSSLTTKYRDLVFMIGFGTQLLMYLSPVIYTIESLDLSFKKYMIFNPMASFIELFRYSVCGAGQIHTTMMVISIAITAILAFVALIVFNKTEKDFIDTV